MHAYNFLTPRQLCEILMRRLPRAGEVACAVEPCPWITKELPMVGGTASSLLSRESRIWNVTWLQLSLAVTASVEGTAKLCGCHPGAAVWNSAALTLLKPYWFCGCLSGGKKKCKLASSFLITRKIISNVSRLQRGPKLSLGEWIQEKEKQEKCQHKIFCVVTLNIHRPNCNTLLEAVYVHM